MECRKAVCGPHKDFGVTGGGRKICPVIGSFLYDCGILVYDSVSCIQSGLFISF